MGQNLSATCGFSNTVSINENLYKQQKQVILLYLLITVLFFGDRYANGMLLTQIQPAFFVVPMDVTAWGLMYTGVHRLFMESRAACIIADSLLILLPVIYTVLAFNNKVKAKRICGWCILIFNFVYALCYVLYPSNSIEGHVGWMLFPVVLIFHDLVNFSFALHFIRYFLLFFFASAGIWKIRNGGVFNVQEMSGILELQHAPYLVTSPEAFFTRLYYWLMQHPVVGYLLYLSAAVIELSFIVGFFTLRFDRLLLVLVFIFLITDVLIMRIKYWEILCLTIPLFFSNKKIMQIV